MPEAPTLSPRLLWIFRLPDRLYRHGLGWLLGRRFLRLVHVGRRTGRRHATVLEVVRLDPRVPEFLVVSGFGPGADWLRNLEATGVAEVTVGGWTFPAEHRRLDVAEAVDVFADYERRNRAIRPVVRSALSWLLGWRYDGSAEARRRMAEQLPMIALRPATVHNPGIQDGSPADDRQHPRRGCGLAPQACSRGARRPGSARTRAAVSFPDVRRRFRTCDPPGHEDEADPTLGVPVHRPRARRLTGILASTAPSWQPR